FTKPVPKPSYEKIVEEPLPETEPMTGFQEVVFKKPDSHFVRYVEPTESELAERIEYDMDKQDESWLRMANHARRDMGEPEVSEIVFELIIDRLEKEWFNLVKDFPKPAKDEQLMGEDVNCAICDDGECENSNAIVFCDGCNLAVHQDCYGVPYIPEGQWLCRKCMLSSENQVNCTFCPNEGGAYKQTNSNRWAHILCAQWIPEAQFANLVYMEPIVVDDIPDSRYKLQCYICRRKKGACIQCSSKNCYAAYHVTCAKNAKIYMKMKTGQGEDIVMRSFCDKHTPKEYKEIVDVEQEINLYREELQSQPSKSSKSGSSNQRKGSSTSRNTKNKRRTDDDDSVNGSPRKIEAIKANQIHHLLQTTPIIPEYIVKKVAAALHVNVRKKVQFVEQVSRYWSLKRESRRGAPLLKRLHLEPWTATTSATKEDETIKAKRQELLRYIRNDLERARLLSELVKKREKEKLKKANVQLKYFEIVFYPVTYVLRQTLDDIISLDPRNLFYDPVDIEEVPDYLDVISNPMDFSTMLKKIANYEYSTIDAFEADVKLICSNATLYNTPDTTWGRAAPRLLAKALPIIEEARRRLTQMPTNEHTGFLNHTIPDELFSYELHPEPKPPTPLPPSPPVISEFTTPTSKKSQRQSKNQSVDNESPIPEPPPGDEELAIALDAKLKAPRVLRNRSVSVVYGSTPSPESKRGIQKSDLEGTDGSAVKIERKFGFPPIPGERRSSRRISSVPVETQSSSSRTTRQSLSAKEASMAEVTDKSVSRTPKVSHGESIGVPIEEDRERSQSKRSMSAQSVVDSLVEFKRTNGRTPIRKRHNESESGEESSDDDTPE
ncbi:nuA3 HAT complex component nto1, partial [Chytridiales sp. JEL 0842]